MQSNWIPFLIHGSSCRQRILAIERREIKALCQNEYTGCKIARSTGNAVGEIVAWLDGEAAFPYLAEDAVHTLEVIVAFHASHARQATWVELPLTGDDRLREVQSG